MTYEESKKLIDAANLLKENCNKNFKENEECDCPFSIGDYICDIGDICPKDWEIPKLCRWTAEDVALAKALKAVGVTEIYGSTSHYRTWKDENMNIGYLPSAAFRNMDYQETVKIDDIIKEAEENE